LFTAKVTFVQFFILVLWSQSIYAQENCASTIDDDSDTFIGDFDIDCFDTDGDGVVDLYDLDDDNDGIFDLDEYECDTWFNPFVQWNANGAMPFEGSILNAPIIASAQNFIFGSGIGGSVDITSYLMDGIDQANLNAAISDDDYIEFGFTMQTGVDANYMNILTWTKFPASTEITANHYGYDLAVMIYKNGSAGSACIQPLYNVPATIPDDYESPIISIPAKYYFLEPGASYKVRLYFFNKTTPGPAHFDDLQIYGSQCYQQIHNDTDGLGNHLDLDSDDDFCYDVAEAGFSDADINGILGSSPETFDGNGQVTSGSNGYTYPNLLFVDDSNDHCFEICGNGLDDNANGIVDEDLPAGISKNMILWLKAESGFTPILWQDQSQYENDAIGFGNPIFANNILNFNPGIGFDGDDEFTVFLPQLKFDSGTHSVAIFAVYRPIDGGTSHGIYGNHGLTSFNQDLSLTTNGLGFGAGFTSVSALKGAFGHLTSFVYDEEDNVSGIPNSSILYHNGSNVRQVTYNENSPIQVDDYLHIGRSGGKASDPFFTGEILEVIVYYEDNGAFAISDMERQQIETYLAIKYGISTNHSYLGSQ